MIPNLNPNDLVIFYTVAREKNLSAAAEKLFITQPAITYHIQSLEEYARVKLIDFKKRQIVLTSHGKELFKYAGEIFQQLTNAERYIEFIRESNIRVGIASVYASVVEPLLTRMFEQQNSGAKMVVKSGNSIEMVQDVIDSTLDLAIVPLFEYGNDKLSFTQVSVPEKIVCFTAPRQELPPNALSWQEVAEYPLVFGPETSVMRRLILKKIEEEGLEKVSVAVEVSNMIWCKAMVRDGKGFGFTAERDIVKEIAEGIFKEVPLKDNVYLMAQAVTRTGISNHIIISFIAQVKKAFGYVDPSPEKPGPAI